MFLITINMQAIPIHLNLFLHQHLLISNLQWVL